MESIGTRLYYLFTTCHISVERSAFFYFKPITQFNIICRLENYIVSSFYNYRTCCADAACNIGITR